MNSIRLLVLVFCVGCAQSTQKQDDQLKRIVSQAKEVGDFQTAISATYQLIAADTNELSYYDSLALYYYNLGNYNSALKTCEHLLEYRTGDTTLIIAAKCASALNRVEDVVSYALAILESNPESLEWRYELSKAYFNLNEGSNCQGELQMLIDHPRSKFETTPIVLGNQVFNVSYYAVSLNLMGVLLANINRYERAKACFEESSAYAPDFPLPKQNLQALSK